MIEKEFVKYEEALALKELGFDEPCFGSWETEYAKVPTYTHSCSQFYKNSNHPKGKVTAPTFSQAFRWFSEKYKLQTYIDFYHSDSYFYKIKSQDGRNIGNIGNIILQGTSVFTRTYEETELACLNKLIQIVKGKKNG